ncbi:MAG: MucR family transcriptional regulator [Holosporales bacterium]|jgi:predicted transcriptional regulator|nr:MucR family transcriptional regulator [Holosporales bacterium]
MSTNLEGQKLVDYTINLLTAYLSNNKIALEEVNEAMSTIYEIVENIVRRAESAKTKPTSTPAVPIEESVHDDYIICLEDGKKLQMLKRHLTTVYSMTIEQYKEKWGLPIDYPVVSPSYAKRRSNIAKTTGLGSTGRKKLKVA